jgi:hypothetical protein
MSCLKGRVGLAIRERERILLEKNSSRLLTITETKLADVVASSEKESRPLNIMMNNM